MIVLDKNTGLPIDPQRPPEDGDWIQITTQNHVTKRQYHDPVNEPQKTNTNRVKPGVIIELMGADVYAKIHNAAYPRGNEIADGNALFFFERGKFPTSSDGMIDLSSDGVSGAFDYFISKGYMDQADKDRILAGRES